MVNNFTANQIGDSFTAKLVTPYENVVNINSWDIIVGVNTPNTIGTLSMTAGETLVTGTGTNLNLSFGSKIIVGNTIFDVIEIIDSNTFRVLEAPSFSGDSLKFYETLDANNFFDYEFKWSQEDKTSDGGIMSEYRPLNNNTSDQDLLGLVFDPAKPLWITVRFTVNRLSTAHFTFIIKFNI